MPDKLAFIGFGEAGQTISAGLLSEGHKSIRAYDILFDDPADAGALARKAEAAGVEIAKGHVDAVKGADIVYLAVTAGSSLEAARASLPGLRAGQLFLDVNSVSPQRKQETAALVAAAGALYVDVAVMAPVSPKRHKVPLLIAGPGARAAMPRLAALGMDAELVSDETGQAAAIKMFRSIMVKGLEALMIESMLAASEYGVEAKVLASLAETFPAFDWQRFSGYGIERMVSHGKRRAEEVREVAATLDGIGLAPLMATAIAERQQWVADLNLKKAFGGKVPSDRGALIDAIRAAIGKRARDAA